MALARALAALATAVSLLLIVPAAVADFDVTASWRQTGENKYELEIKNEGDAFNRVRVSPVPHSGCTPPEGGDCGPQDDSTIQYVFLERRVENGDTVVLEFTTSEPLPDDHVLNVEVRLDQGPGTVFTAKKRRQAAADLEVAINPVAPFGPLMFLTGAGKVLVNPVVRLENNGPDAAENVVILMQLDRSPRLVRGPWPPLQGVEERRQMHYEYRDGQHVPTGLFGDPYFEIVNPPGDCEQARAVSYRCELGTLPAGATRRWVLPLSVMRNGAIELFASVTAATRDPGPGRNRAEFKDTVIELPDTGAPGCADGRGGRAAGSCNTAPRRIPAGTKPVFRGTARGVSAVDIAVARVEHSARPAAADFVCEWLANKRAKFVPGHSNGRRCLLPAATLKARGAEKWSLRLLKPLPKGKYVMFTRGRAAGHVYESDFSAKDGNRIELIVG